jgi:hypothetical protein
MDEDFRQEAIDAVMSLGIPEDEAEMLVEDYYGEY